MLYDLWWYIAVCEATVWYTLSMANTMICRQRLSASNYDSCACLSAILIVLRWLMSEFPDVILRYSCKQGTLACQVTFYVSERMWFCGSITFAELILIVIVFLLVLYV